eukprot:Skav235084  [mRNA]  locus=scaffold2106:79984:82028:- [translate_table: standard]
MAETLRQLPCRQLMSSRWPVVWSQLQRLMDVMANQRLGDPPNQDEVRLRHAPGRMVIDVHFRRPLVAAPVELGGCVVEILNAYSKPGCITRPDETRSFKLRGAHQQDLSSGMSQSSEVLRLLRSAAGAQRVHQAALEETKENLQVTSSRWEERDALDIGSPVGIPIAPESS